MTNQMKWEEGDLLDKTLVGSVAESRHDFSRYLLNFGRQVVEILRE